MKRVASDYSKILWKKRALEYREENPGVSDAELEDVVDGYIGADDVFDWQEYAALYYREPSGSFREGPARQFVA